MTPAQIKTQRKALGLSAQGFALAVGVADGRTVRRWEAGERDVPGSVVRLMEAAERFPAVRKWLIANAASRGY